MNVDNELHYRPLKVYVIRNKAGALAPRTKIYPSKSGGTMGFNSFVEGMIHYYLSNDNPVYRKYQTEMDTMYHHWCWGGGKKNFDSYAKLHDALTNPPASINCFIRPINVPRPAYDEFMRIIDKIYDEWSVEEVAQDYA